MVHTGTLEPRFEAHGHQDGPTTVPFCWSFSFHHIVLVDRLRDDVWMAHGIASVFVYERVEGGYVTLASYNLSRAQAVVKQQ